MISSTIPFEKFNFPCGETQIIVRDIRPYEYEAEITFEYENNSEIFDLCLLVDALRRSGHIVNKLHIPYVPYSRQDRVEKSGECFSLFVFCNIINNLGFKTVVTFDPHSNATYALIKNLKIIHQHDIFIPFFFNKENYWLVSPDSGALKKLYKLAKLTKQIGVIECSKKRDTTTGEILETCVYGSNDLQNRDCYIVDDICDGGRTFIEISKKLKLLNCGEIHLMVTHGFFTKGLSVFDGFIDHIYTRKGQIK